MIEHFTRRTLSRDLTVWILLTITGVIMSIAILNYVLSAARIERDLDREAKEIVERLAEILALPLWNIDVDQVRQIAEIYTEKEDVVGLRITDEADAVFFQISSDQRESSITNSRRIKYESQVVGTVEVSLAKRRISKAKKNILYTSFVIASFLVLAVVIAIYSLMGRYLNRPLKELVEGIDVIARGRYGDRLPILAQLDINEIAQEINKMAEAIQSREEKLHRARENLEERVILRTNELGKANEQLLVEVGERKQAELKREQLIKELEAKNAELEQFAYTVSHDLKSPLVTIRGFLGLLEKDASAGHKGRMEHDIEQISAAAGTMIQLLDELLELARIGRVMGSPVEVSLAELAREAVGALSGKAEMSGVEIEIDPEMPVVVGDRARLLEVLQNLIDNAVRFMGDQATPRLQIGVRKDVGEEVFFVRDNGSGIDPKYHEKVFGLFERLEPSVQGTGVGLALVKRIVEVHGGRTWVESEGRRQGSTFCFTLSRQESVDNRSPA